MNTVVLVRSNRPSIIVARPTPGPHTIVRSGGARGKKGDNAGTPNAETPVGAIDGVNRVFTISTAPTLLFLMLNGLTQKDSGVDFVIAGTTITFNEAPHAGDTMLALFLS